MRKGPGSVYDKWNIYNPWSFVTQIFHNGQPSHGDDRKTFNLTKRNPWFSSFLVSSNPLSRTSW